MDEKQRKTSFSALNISRQWTYLFAASMLTLARHSFATMMLTLGADLYTTSKLLGHTDVRMTQAYARIVNEKKARAVNLVNGVF